jgi:uncharacterized protein YggT (Ycf19 family)
MTDDKLLMDEAERAADYEAVKRTVRSDVAGEIAVEAARRPAGDVQDLAGSLREAAVTEVEATHQEVERGRAAARASQVVDYVFFLIYGLLGVRLLLELFAARETAGFVQFVKSVTNPIYAPFRGIVPSPTTPEGFTLALPIIVALVAYMLLHAAINGLLRILAHRKVEI